MGPVPKALQELGGCGLIMLAWTVFGIGYMIYWFSKGGDPEVKNFRNACYSQQLRARGERYVSDLPEQIQFDIIRHCDAALRQYLDAKRR